MIHAKDQRALSQSAMTAGFGLTWCAGTAEDRPEDKRNGGTRDIGPVGEEVEKIKACTGYARRECLTCDEGGACMIDLLSAFSMLSDPDDAD